MATTEREPVSSWIWLLCLFTLASFIETIFWGQVGAFTPFYLPQLGIPPDQVVAWTGWIASLASFAGLPFLPFWGALADRYSRKPVIIRSFVAYLSAGIIVLLAKNVWMFLLGRAVISLSLGNSGLMMTTLTERVPGNRHGFALSIMNGAAPIGFFLGPLIGGPIVDQWGFPALILIDTVLMVIVILLLAFGYHDPYSGTSQGSILQMGLDSIRIILQNPRLRALFPALFLLFSGWLMATTYMPVIVTGQYQGLDPGTAVGLILGVGGLAALALSPVLGWLADRFGLWRTVFIGAAFEVVLWSIPLLIHGLASLGVAWALINGVASSVFAISFGLLAQAVTDKVRGRVMSFSYLPVMAGSVVGPAIGSFVTRTSVMNIFPTAGLLTLLGIGTLARAKHQGTEMRLK